MAEPGRPRKCDPKVDNLCSNIRQEKYDIAKTTLKEFGIDATDGYGRTALINAVIENKPQFIRWLIDNGANINHQDRNGFSVLHFVGQNGLINLAEYFLDNGANPNLKDKHGNTALMTAVHNSFREKKVVSIFLEHAANPDIVNNYEVTPRALYKTINGTEITELIEK